MNVIKRAKNILISPATEWRKIDGETTSIQQLITGYLIPLSFIGAIASFIGWGLIGISIPGVHYGGISLGIVRAIGYIIHVILIAIIGTYLIDGLAPTFKSEKNLGRSAQLVIYSYTPSLICSVFSIFPASSFLGSLCGLYGLYLIFTGLHTIKKTPDDQRIGYIIATILVLIAVYVIMGLIVYYTIGRLYGGELYRGY